MFPLRDNVPARRYPIVNVSLIWINILVFLYELSLGPRLEEFFSVYGVVPDKLLHGGSPRTPRRTPRGAAPAREIGRAHV